MFTGRTFQSERGFVTGSKEYFIRADQGRPDILELFDEDADIYFPQFGFVLGRHSLFELVQGFEGSLEYIRHDYERLTFIPSGDYLVVEGTSQGKMSGKYWEGGQLQAAPATVETKSFSGNMWPQLRAVFPGQEPTGPGPINFIDVHRGRDPYSPSNPLRMSATPAAR